MGMERASSPCSTDRSTACATWTKCSATSLTTIYSTVDAIEECVTDADLVIGAVLVPGAAAPKLVDAQA